MKHGFSQGLRFPVYEMVIIMAPAQGSLKIRENVHKALVGGWQGGVGL